MGRQIVLNQEKQRSGVWEIWSERLLAFGRLRLLVEQNEAQYCPAEKFMKSLNKMLSGHNNYAELPPARDTGSTLQRCPIW